MPKQENRKAYPSGLNHATGDTTTGDTTMGKLQTKLHGAVAEALAKLRNPDRGSNTGKFLFDIFVWQEVSSLADKRLRDAWKAAQVESSVVEPDDVLREKGPGDHITEETDHFSLYVKISEGRKAINRDLFIEKVAKRYKLKVADLEKIAETCRVEGTRACTKRVLEAADA